MPSNTPRRILGIDPGYDRLGWAIIEHSGSETQLIECGCIQTNKKADRFTRYQQLEAELELIVTQHQPMLASIEQLYAGQNTSTVIAVAEARGIVIGLLLRHQLSIRELNPSTVKLAVAGHGRADKAAMKKMIMLQIGKLSPRLQQKLATELDDTFDAIGLALTATTLGTSVESI